MSSAICTVNFAYADGTAKGYALGPFNVNSDAVTYFKNRVQNFNTIDTTKQKKFTNLADYLVSENGAAFTGVKSASITVSQATRIFDAANYGG